VTAEPFDASKAREVRGLNVGATRIDGEPWVLVAVRTRSETIVYRIPLEGAETLEDSIGEARRKLGRLVIAKVMPNGKRG
jgi:hypothetical protein